MRLRAVRHSLLPALVLAVLCVSAETADARGRGPILTRDQLPAGLSIGDGRSPLEAAVTDDAKGASGEAARITLTRTDSEDGTTVTVTNPLPHTVKYDLYISPDGKRFIYTSSCPLVPKGSGFEMWPHPIHTFALGNPRVVAGGKMVCE